MPACVVGVQVPNVIRGVWSSRQCTQQWRRWRPQQQRAQQLRQHRQQQQHTRQPAGSSHGGGGERGQCKLVRAAAGVRQVRVGSVRLYMTGAGRRSSSSSSSICSTSGSQLAAAMGEDGGAGQRKPLRAATGVQQVSYPSAFQQRSYVGGSNRNTSGNQLTAAMGERRGRWLASNCTCCCGHVTGQG
jgi:hypothetical protein